MRAEELIECIRSATVTIKVLQPEPYEQPRTEEITYVDADRLVEALAKFAPPCPHENMVTHYTGDGLPVEFCHNCGRNFPGKYRSSNTVPEEG